MKYLALVFISILILACSSETTESTKATNENIAESEVEFIAENMVEAPEEMGVEPTDPATTFKAFDLCVYLNDPDEKSTITNVRDAPSGNVLLELNNQDDYIFDVVGMKDGWFKISNISNVEENDFEMGQPFGWVHWSVVGAGTRNYGNSTIELFQEPSSKSTVTGKLEQESFVRITDGTEGWVKVKYDFEGVKAEGWMKIDMICGNPYTTCS